VLLLICGATTTFAQTQIDDKHTITGLRLIGHELLLLNNDSTSRVLPIEKEGESYILSFSSEYSYMPGQIVSTIDSIVLQNKLAQHYIVEVKECISGQVVYSYQTNFALAPTFKACGTREQPKGCYTIAFTIVNATPMEEPEVAVALNGRTAQEGSSFGTLIVVLFLLLISAAVYFLVIRRKPILQADTIAIGSYRFDKRNMELCYNNTKTELTGKESDLLALLHSSANTTLERDTILQKVWGDEGDYVGRTLDVFISKLRKKLEADTTVKIVNIRGVGYKLVVND